MSDNKVYWNCECCGVQILKQSKSRHERSKKHERNSNGQPQQPQPRGAKYHCNVCDCSVTSRSRHERTKKHERNSTVVPVVPEVVPEPVPDVVVAEPEPEPVPDVVVAEPEPEPVPDVVVPEPEPTPEVVEEKEVEYKSPRSRDRLECFERNKFWINDPNWRKGKGCHLRRGIIWFLQVFSKSNFRDEEHEYQSIEKFGRGGFWSKEHIQSFPPDIQKILVEDCAVSYGLFDY